MKATSDTVAQTKLIYMKKMIIYIVLTLLIPWEAFGLQGPQRTEPVNLMCTGVSYTEENNL